MHLDIKVAALMAAVVIGNTHILSGEISGRDEYYENIKNHYRPSGKAGGASVKDRNFFSNLRDYLWVERLNKPVEEELERFLGPKLFFKDDPHTITVVAPGDKVPANANNVDLGVRHAALSQPGFFTKVSSTFFPRTGINSSWNSGTTVEQCVGSPLLKELGKDAELKGLLAEWMTPGDFPPLVLKNLCDIKQNANQEDWEELKNIAVAIALVDDQNYPGFFPHGQVEKVDLPRGAMTPTEKFMDLAESRRKGELLFDITQLTVGEAMFLVNHNATRDEMLWARANRPVNIPDMLADKAYNSIRYAHSRADEGRLTWKGLPYTLSNIKMMGGICVDQAYYTDIMCKAAGIPTMIFTGSGDAGGHAWVGFLTQGGQWNTKVGRDSAKYLTGKTFNPQTWEVDTDRIISPGGAVMTEEARLELTIADLFFSHGDTDLGGDATKAAISIEPENPGVWRRRISQLEEEDDPNNTIRELKAALQKYRMSIDTKTLLELGIARAERQNGNSLMANTIEKRVMDVNLAERGDLSVEAIAASVDSLLRDGEVDKAIGEHRRFLTRIPEGSRGDFFYKVSRPMIMEIYEGGDKNKARGVVRLLKQYLIVENGSIINADIEKLDKKTRQ